MAGDREQRCAEFLAEAAKADRFAAEAKDSQLQASWKKIADSYRELAARNS
jgi:hypothetical protein